MQVFKLFCKIIKKNSFLVCLYLGIFILIISLLIAGIKREETYEASKVDVYIEVEEDNQSTKDFLAYLEPYIDQKDIKNRKVEDALFWDDIDLYIYIPANFYEEVLNDGQPLVMKSTPDSMESYTLVSRINEYLNYVKENIRLKLTTKDEALNYTTLKFKEQQKVEVELQTSSNINGISSMFNIGSYVIASLTLLIVGLVSFELRTTDIARRLNISPFKISKRNILLTVCYTFFSLSFVLFIVAVGFMMFKADLVHHLGYYIMNACLFAFVMVCLALLMSSLFKSNTAFNCVNATFPLAVSFISGCMVDLKFMPEYTKGMARIFPTIYIVEANNYIGSCSQFQFGHYFKLIWPCFLFIIIFVALTIFIHKKNARSEN